MSGSAKPRGTAPPQLKAGERESVRRACEAASGGKRACSDFQLPGFAGSSQKFTFGGPWWSARARGQLCPVDAASTNAPAAKPRERCASAPCVRGASRCTSCVLRRTPAMASRWEASLYVPSVPEKWPKRVARWRQPWPLAIVGKATGCAADVSLSYSRAPGSVLHAAPSVACVCSVPKRDVQSAACCTRLASP